MTFEDKIALVAIGLAYRFGVGFFGYLIRYLEEVNNGHQLQGNTRLSSRRGSM